MAETTKKPPVPAWALADGTPKPEYSLPLRTPLSDGTKALALFEPNIKTLRRASKLFATDAHGNTTPDSAIAFGAELISGVTGIPSDIVEELPGGVFKQAVEYLQSFN